MRILLGAAFAAAALFTGHPSLAAQPLTYVSATGNDSKPCTSEAAACKTLQHAISVTDVGGEVRLLTNIGGGSTVNIKKSLIVNGAGNTFIGMLVIQNASAIVTVRALGLNGQNTVSLGVAIAAAKAVHIENCTVERYLGSGIDLDSSSATKLFVTDSSVHDNGYDGLEVFGPTSEKLTVDGSQFENNTKDGIEFDAGQGTISNSTASANKGMGISVHGGGLNITDTIAAANSSGIAMFAGDVTLRSVVSRGNTDYGLLLNATGMTARISDSTFTGNANGVDNFAAGPILTSGNNVISGNTNKDVNGTLTPLPSQ